MRINLSLQYLKLHIGFLFLIIELIFKIQVKLVYHQIEGIAKLAQLIFSSHL